MIISNVDKAKILTQALPYIQKYNKKRVVIKYGGNAMLNHKLKTAVISDLILLSLVGIDVILVHGGGPEINDMLDKLKIETRFVDGLRYTDESTLEVVQMVLAGKTNKDLVNMISLNGGKAIGLSGLDCGLIQAKKLEGDYGYVGEITDIDIAPVLDILDKGYMPVISTIAQGVDSDLRIARVDANDIGSETSSMYNINADTAAAEIAVALKAEKLVLLTDIKGLMADVKYEDTLIPVVRLDEIDELKKRGIISGGMIPKIDCCEAAIRGGVNRAHIIDGRIQHSLLIEMLSDEGIGTMFVR